MQKSAHLPPLGKNTNPRGIRRFLTVPYFHLFVALALLLLHCLVTVAVMMLLPFEQGGILAQVGGPVFANKQKKKNWVKERTLFYFKAFESSSLLM